MPVATLDAFFLSKQRAMLREMPESNTVIDSHNEKCSDRAVCSYSIQLTLNTFVAPYTYISPGCLNSSSSSSSSCHC